MNDRQAPDTTMILAAGFGKRLRPITNTVPKPLVPVAGRTMLDRALDTAHAAGLRRAVINIHYLGEQIIAHSHTRTDLDIAISDERDRILETAGGVAKALPLLGDRPFALLNADTVWIDHGTPNLTRMMKMFDPVRMDMLLLLAGLNDVTGHSGGVDFTRTGDGRLKRATGGHGLIYAGAAIVDPRAMADAKAEPHSLNVHFDAAMARGRLFGLQLEDGHWYTVGTPDGLRAVEAHLAQQRI